MVVTTGGFQSCRCLTSGMSKVSRYPKTDPDPAATRRAIRATMASFFGWRQKGVLDGGPPEGPFGPDGDPPGGGPTPGGWPPEAPADEDFPRPTRTHETGLGTSLLHVV